eukprot:455554_1
MADEPNDTNDKDTSSTLNSTEILDAPKTDTQSMDSSWHQVPNSSNNNNNSDEEESFYDVEEAFINNENKNDNKEEEKVEEEGVEKNFETALQHKTEGNKYYKLAQYDEALYEYTQAIKYCPLTEDKEKEYMSIFYGNRAACYIALEEWKDAIDECTESIEYNDKYIKAYWRRAKSYEKLSKYFDAKTDYEKILDIDPNHEISKANLNRIEPLVQKQFEEQKEEVIDKLKGGANWLLGKVGLSLDNFETQQNPETGAYNIQFKQNK